MARPSTISISKIIMIRVYFSQAVAAGCADLAFTPMLVRSQTTVRRAPIYVDLALEVAASANVALEAQVDAVSGVLPTGTVALRTQLMIFSQKGTYGGLKILVKVLVSTQSMS